MLGQSMDVFGQAIVYVFLVSLGVQTMGSSTHDCSVTVSTLAGTGQAGYQDGNPWDTRFNRPYSLCASPDGTWLYVTEYNNHMIRKVRLSDGETFTLTGDGNAGLVDGAATNAQFYFPAGVSTSPDGHWLYVADRQNHGIRKVSTSDGEVFLLTGGSTSGWQDGGPTFTRFNEPSAITTSYDGLNLYVADRSNNRIRKVRVIDGEVSTLAGDGTASFRDGEATYAQFSGPNGVSTSPDGMYLYVSDMFNHKIRKVVVSDGKVFTLAGIGTGGVTDGGAPYAQFWFPHQVSTSPDGVWVYVADMDSHRLRKVNVADGEVHLLAGSTAGFLDTYSYHNTYKYPPPIISADSVKFMRPSGIWASPDGITVYASEYDNHKIREIRSVCGCGEGYTSYEGQSCVMCKEGSYKDKIGNHTCQDCPSSTTSGAGSTSVDNCTKSVCTAILPLTEVFKVDKGRAPTTYSTLFNHAISHLQSGALITEIKEALGNSCAINISVGNEDELCWNKGTRGGPNQGCTNTKNGC